MHREPDPPGETDSRSPADPARPPPAPGRSPHRLTGLRAAAALADLGLAPVAAGVIARRRGMMALLERVGADDRAVRRMHRLRREFGSGPVELVLPGRRVLVPLDPADVSRILDGAPTPFHPANREKIAALRTFQPHGVLISEGAAREQRRRLNEQALDTDRPLHHLADPFAGVVADAAREQIRAAVQRGGLDAAHFTTDWWRLVRRIVLGRRAREDDSITDRLWRLRAAGNWSYAALPHRRLRERFYEQLYDYVQTAETDSLAGALAQLPTAAAVDPVGQIPHWLFAFDAAGMATLRALAVLSTHPEHLSRARLDAHEPERAMPRPYLRACVLESVRLWPTTPAVLRDTTEDTEWGRGAERFTVEAGAGLLIPVPAFHRDPDLLPFAHSFDPDIWLDGRAERYPQLVPFSAGPARCPGRDLVLFLTTSLLAHLIDELDLELRSHPQPTPAAALPITFDNFRIDFTARARALQAAQSHSPGGR
nr:cytochrome P450 [Nocardia nova]